LTSVPTAYSLQLEIANAVVRANKDLFGRGPTKSRVIIQGDIVVCVLADCLTTAERTLVNNGHLEVVARLRNQMQGVARPKLTSIVEGLTGQRVVACTTGIDLQAGEHVVTFRLDGPVTRA
jgi:uncharacterized protein YbcI